MSSGSGLCRGIGSVKTRLIGKNNEEFGLCEIRYVSGKRIIIADLDFINRNGIILVDDGNHIVMEQRPEGIIHTRIAFPVREIVPREEHKRSPLPVSTKPLLVSSHQPNLSDSRRGL